MGVRGIEPSFSNVSGLLPLFSILIFFFVASQELGRESSAAQTTVGHALGTGSDLTRFDDRCSCALPLPVQGVSAVHQICRIVVYMC